ncbi:MAG: hypothetical protein KDA69_22030, partial [Planctomycetaceae bacterium]|nr:hypothetical protein [Planctomycetaceae bacterium]
TPVIEWTLATTGPSATYEIYVSSPGVRGASYHREGLVGTNHRIDRPLSLGTHRIWVRTHFADGSRSEWSAAQSLEIGPRTLVDFNAPAITWTPVRGATHYELWVDYLGGESPAVPQLIHEAFVTENRWTLSPTSPKGTYRVWVRAIRAESGDKYLARWSTPINFRVE